MGNAYMRSEREHIWVCCYILALRKPSPLFNHLDSSLIAGSHSAAILKSLDRSSSHSYVIRRRFQE